MKKKKFIHQNKPNNQKKFQSTKIFMIKLIKSQTSMIDLKLIKHRKRKLGLV